MRAQSMVTPDDENVSELVEECFHLLISGAKDYAIIILNVSGNIISWNEGAERIQGYRSEEVIGRHVSLFYTPQECRDGKPASDLEQAVAVGRVEVQGWRLRADGTRFMANVALTALRDNAGKLRGFAEVTRDITEQIQAEKVLRESEERFRLLVSGVKDYAIIMLDERGHIASWNEGAQRVSGYESAEVLGKHFSIFYTEEDLSSGKPESELSTATRVGRCEDEGWRVRRDSSLFFADTVITSLIDSDGILRGFTKIFRDTTERKCALEDMAEMQLRLDLALESAEVGVWDLDVRSGIVWRSGKHDEIMGIDPATINWRIELFLAHVVPEDRQTVQAAIDATKKNDRFTTTCRIVRLDGALRWIGAHGEVLRDDRGRAKRVIGIIVDVTDRKEQEERHRLMAVMQEREDFMATLTHDMKNPLLGANRVLHSMSSGLVGPLTEQQSSLLGSLIESNCSVLSLISNLIEVYRMEKEASILTSENVDLHTLLESSVSRVREYAKLRDVELSVEIRKVSGFIRADSGAIARVFENLLDNALKFTRKRGAIKVRLYEQDGFALVEIEDDGPGVAPEDQTRLFKRFSQGLVGKRFSGGNGLGLYLCKQIVEAHGGTISCESIVETFTIFKFGLPLKRAEVAKEPCALPSMI